MTFVCIGQAKYTSLMSMLDRGRTLFISSSKTMWYAEVMTTEVNEHLWDELRNEPDGWAMRVTVQFQEVSLP